MSELAVTLRQLIRKNQHQLNVSRMVQALNEAFSRQELEGRFATAIFATYFTPTDHLVLCNAGHPRPLWYQASRKAWRALDHEASECAEQLLNLPLGIVEPTDYHQFAVQLEPQDLVVMFTDAVPEAKSERGFLGEDGLLEIVQRLEPSDAEGFGRALLREVSEFRAGEAGDDLSLLVLKHTAEDVRMGPLKSMLAGVAKTLGIIDY